MGEEPLPCTLHIDFCPIYRGSHQEFSRAISMYNNALGVIAPPPSLVKTCESELPQLLLLLVVDKNVGALYMTIDHAFLMNVFETCQHLLTERL